MHVGLWGNFLVVLGVSAGQTLSPSCPVAEQTDIPFDSWFSMECFKASGAVDNWCFGSQFDPRLYLLWQDILTGEYMNAGGVCEPFGDTPVIAANVTTLGYDTMCGNSTAISTRVQHFFNASTEPFLPKDRTSLQILTTVNTLLARAVSYAGTCSSPIPDHIPESSVGSYTYTQAILEWGSLTLIFLSLYSLNRCFSKSVAPIPPEPENHSRSLV